MAKSKPKKESAKLQKLRSEAATEEHNRKAKAIPQKDFKKLVGKALSTTAPRGEKAAIKAVKEKSKLKGAAKRVISTIKAKQSGIELHPSEQKRLNSAAKVVQKRGPGRPRTTPLPDPNKEKLGRGRPKSDKTKEREKAIAAGTYTPRNPGRPRKEAVAKPAPKHTNSPILKKRGKGYSPSQARVGIAMRKLRVHRSDSSQDGHNEYGLHKRGHTLVSYIPKEGAIYKVMRRTMRDKNRSVSVTKTAKSDHEEKSFKNFHSTRDYTSPKLHVTEHISHNANPRNTGKTRLIAKKTMGGAVENEVKTAMGRKSKAWYPGFMGGGATTSLPEPSKLERSIGRLPKKKRASTG